MARWSFPLRRCWWRPRWPLCLPLCWRRGRSCWWRHRRPWWPHWLLGCWRWRRRCFSWLQPGGRSRRRRGGHRSSRWRPHAPQRLQEVQGFQGCVCALKHSEGPLELRDCEALQAMLRQQPRSSSQPRRDAIEVINCKVVGIHPECDALVERPWLRSWSGTRPLQHVLLQGHRSGQAIIQILGARI